MSDHSIISTNLQINELQYSSGLWKHNNALLTELDYINTINTKIEEIKKQYALPVYDRNHLKEIPNSEIQFTINDQLFLETLLMEIRGKSISYSSFRKKVKNERELEIQSKIKLLEENLSQSNLDEYYLLRNEVEQLQKEKMKGSIIWSRVKWNIDGEKPTRFFCGLEKSNTISKTVQKIIKDDGSEITNQKQILEEIKTFYETLYTSNQSDFSDINFDGFISNLEIPRLSVKESESIEGRITMTEAFQTLKNMKSNKSPGTSGFNADFYKVFWGKLGDFVVRALNEAYNVNSLSETQTQGLITCIPKGNKPKEYLKNWWPITLLNTVYKIGTGCIANRIKSFLPKLIHTDQSGFIKDRYIGENLRLIYDLLHYTEANNIPGILLLIDFEKAFDSLSWSFINKTLKTFRFGPSVIKWFNIFYQDAKSTVSQCGYLSDFFKIERGCRQGDPLSSYIFILCAEILSINIRNNKHIKGIRINQTEFKLSQFADDTSIILDGSERSLNETLNVLSKFSKLSGLNMNFDKTKVSWIGKKKYSADTIKTKWKLVWDQNKFKLLGIFFHVDLNKIIDINFLAKFKEIENIVKKWNRRVLTPIGKITVLKSLLISKMNHLFFALPNPSEKLISKLNDVFYSFIWEGCHKVKKSVITKDYVEGGLKMLNIENYIKALKITGIRRLLKDNGGWSNIIKEFIDIEKLCLFGKDYIKILIEKINNPFWIDTLKALSQLFDNISIESTNIAECPIFHNNNIHISA